jgi:hypothetical protein
MTNLLQHLQEKFCQELNNGWLQAIKNNEGSQMDTSRFGEMVALISEATEQGYEFNLHYSASEYIAERIMESDKEKDLYGLPEWNSINPIIKMINECDEQQWEQLKPHLESLKSQKVQPILQQYTIEFSRENGPFYPGRENQVINVYGQFGSVGADLLLVTLIYGRKEKQMQ